MLVLLPLVCLGLLFLAAWRRRPAAGRREALLLAALANAILTLALAEILGLFSALAAPGLALGWGLSILASGALAWRARPPLEGSRCAALARPTRLSTLLGLPIFGVTLTTGLTAIVGWPNTWDAMTYHLARVAHWQQDRSLAFYPTHITHQLFYPPWAEEAILHLRILGPDERTANLVAWLCLIAALLATSLVARELGASPRGQLMAALCCATLPMGIVQASSTQNDLVAGAWLVSLAYGLLSWRRRPSALVYPMAAGAGLGLALATKTTAYLYAAPLVLLLPGRAWRTSSGLRASALAGIIALAINTPHFARNLETFGTPIGPFAASRGGTSDNSMALANEAFSAPLIASNLVRNAALQLWTPLRSLNASIDSAIRAGHSALGLNVNDPRTTWQDSKFSLPGFTALDFSDYRAPNPLHLLLICASIVVVAASARHRSCASVTTYCVALVLGFVLFCVVLKWQPYNSRLHLPLFMLWSPVVGLVLQSHGRLLALIALLLSVWAAPFALANTARPLFGEGSVLTANRLDQYFREFPSGRAAYLGASNFLQASDCREIGLVLGDWGSWEYPLWALDPDLEGGQARLEHVNVVNSSKWLASRWPAFSPCAVVAVDVVPADGLEVNGRAFGRAWSGSQIQILLADSPPLPARSSP